MVLIVAIILTTGGFSALADTVSDAVVEDKSAIATASYIDADIEDEEQDLTTYDEEAESDFIEASIASPSCIEDEGAEDDVQNHITNEEEEPEEEKEDDETTTVESSEDEASTTSENNLIDADDVASPSDIKDVVEEQVISILATESEIILDIDKASESEINIETTLPLFGDAPLFGDPAPDTIWLGTYPQSITWQSDGSAYNIVEPIKWKKLSESGTEAFYVADKILDNVSYHAAGGSITWAGSGIYTWLNDTSADGFIGKAFTANQLADADGIVLEKTITTTDSADTNDKAFLLSVYEVQNLITPASSRRIYGTEYAKTKVNGGPTLEVDSEHSPWWLRTPGTAGPENAAYVRVSELLMTTGGSVNSQTIGARPAIYINLSSSLYNASNNGVSWDLNGRSLANGSALWSSMNTYFGGQLLPTANNFTAPAGKHFIGMQINTAAKSSVNTIIPDNQEGNITLRPIFGDTAADKVINYNFGTGTFSNWSLLPKNYTPGTAKPLLSKFDIARYIIPPADQEFKGFAKSGSTNIITEIASSENDNIDLVAIYGDRPTITWNMGTGTLNPAVASASYISGIEWPLPSQNKITPPAGNVFDHWILRRAGAADIDPTTSIPATIDVNVEVVAVYSAAPTSTPTPTPDPEPYNPGDGGRGGSSGGGGGGGGGVISAIQNQIMTTISIDQIKILKAAINSNEVTWTYDPIMRT